MSNTSRTTQMDVLSAVSSKTIRAVLGMLCISVAMVMEIQVARPATTLKLLGIRFDTNRLVMCLPDNKLSALTTLLTECSDRSCRTKRESFSLIVYLTFTAKVAPPDRTFVCRLIDLSCTAPLFQSRLVLTPDAKAGIERLWSFLHEWNGRTLLHEQPQTHSPDLSIHRCFRSDWLRHLLPRHQFRGTWSKHQLSNSIALKELAPIVLACNTWAPLWSRQ